MGFRSYDHYLCEDIRDLMTWARPSRGNVGRWSTLSAIKRLIGRPFDDPLTKKDQDLVPYEIVKADNGDAWIQVDGDKYSPSQVSAFILQ